MKTIFITGASSGIGKATTHFFAKKGWNVVATMRTPELDKDFSDLDNVFVTKLDVQKKETIQTALDLSIKRFGKIDVLVNNAGYGTSGIFELATDEQIKRQFEVNVFGLMTVTQAFLPHFRENKGGLIINVSSMGGRITIPTLSLYHATKFAVEGFTESVAHELAPLNIQFKLIEPGSIQTDFGGRSLESFFENAPDDYYNFIESYTSARKKMSENNHTPGTPEMIANAIFDAATDQSKQLRYIVGEDAKQLISLKENQGDEGYSNYINTMFQS